MDSGIDPWIPIAAALIGAAVGFIGAGGLRLILDRRQELVRAQGYGRVILDELRGIAGRLDPELEQDNPILATEPLPMSAWRDHRADVAAVLLHAEFIGLSGTYRAVAEANHISAAVRRDWEVAAAHGRAWTPVIPEGAMQERQFVRITVEQIGIPCIQWLADGELQFFRRRRVGGLVLTPYPDVKCRCEHRWDCHRWSWDKRRIRLRWRRSKTRSVAHECNVAGCACRRFSWSESRLWERPLRRVFLLPQAPLISTSEQAPPIPEHDPSIPDSAQPGAVVTVTEHQEMEARSHELREAGVIP